LQRKLALAKAGAEDSKRALADSIAKSVVVKAPAQEHELVELQAKRDTLATKVLADPVKVATISESLASLKEKRNAHIRDMQEAILAEESLDPLEVLREQKTAAQQELNDRIYGIDVAFLLDVTGSMQPYIDEVKSKLDALATAIEGMVSDPSKPQRQAAVLRFAFVGYRDFDDADRLEVRDFMPREQLEEMRGFISGVSAHGGDDSAEDVLAGLNACTQLSWRGSTRLVIHVCDAPPHGRDWHDETIDDNYPDEAPAGSLPLAGPTTLLSCMQYFLDNCISYTHLQIDECTERMYQGFVEAFTHRPNLHTVVTKHTIDDPEADFLPITIASVRNALTASRR